MDLHKKEYAKNYCQGFCTLCGTACAEHLEEIERLKEESKRTKCADRYNQSIDWQNHTLTSLEGEEK